MFLWEPQGSNVEPSVKRHANLASALEQALSEETGLSWAGRRPSLAE